MGETLEKHWTGEIEEQYSLRNLANFFNQEMLAVEFDRHNAAPLEG